MDRRFWSLRASAGAAGQVRQLERAIADNGAHRGHIIVPLFVFVIHVSESTPRRVPHNAMRVLCGAPWTSILVHVLCQMREHKEQTADHQLARRTGMVLEIEPT